ncbi:MAG TPA: alpha/beta hydrolase [Oxalobacteraceae bacterium]|jgi:pimeloyl-ACP methyl ester carboxylesterase|nr:alpha/beta hydrolase [Oxalobacteraceae bacterium]
MRTLTIALAALAAIVIGLFAFTHFAPERATAILVNLDRTRSGLTRKQIDLPNGLRYVYLEGGQGEPLMLLHGFGADKENFTRVARHLTPHYHVIVPDQIGFGESSHPQRGDYSPVTQANNLHGLALALGIKQLDLGGSSMGGQIALTYASLYPTEVSSLWLLAPAGIWSAPPSELARSILTGGKNNLMTKNEEEFAQLFKFVMNDPPYIPRFVKNVMAQEDIVNYDLHLRIFEQIKNDDTLEKRVAGLPTPTLIVWGEQDRALNIATAAVLHKLLPRSQVITIPGVGHLPMIERDGQVAADYIRFRNGVGKIDRRDAPHAPSTG